MKCWKTYGFFLLSFLFVLTTSCSDDDDNSWRDRNEDIFNKLGEVTVNLPRDMIDYSTNPVTNYTSREDVKPEDVITHPSGLKYRILKKGTGTETVYFTSKVKFNFEGRRIDGTVFESTYDIDTQGPYETFVCGDNIKDIPRGWTEVLQVMNEGDKFEVYVPWNFGYSDEYLKKRNIEAHSTLIYIMELVELVEQ